MKHTPGKIYNCPICMGLVFGAFVFVAFLLVCLFAIV